MNSKLSNLPVGCRTYSVHLLNKDWGKQIYHKSMKNPIRVGDVIAYHKHGYIRKLRGNQNNYLSTMFRYGFRVTKLK